MDPSDIVRMRAIVDQVRSIAEDFSKVFHNRLLHEAPDLRLQYLSSMADGGESFCRSMDLFYELIADPGAMHRALTQSVGLYSGSAERFHRIRHEAFVWTAERCLADIFTAEDRAAFRRLYDIKMAMISGEAGTPPERDIAAPSGAALRGAA